jgi:hypothetical protein
MGKKREERHTCGILDFNSQHARWKKKEGIKKINLDIKLSPISFVLALLSLSSLCSPLFPRLSSLPSALLSSLRSPLSPLFPPLPF